MTNWEWITSDKARFAKIISDEFVEKHVDPWWCKGVCPHRINGVCTAEENEYENVCGNDIAVIMMYLDAEHED